MSDARDEAMRGPRPVDPAHDRIEALLRTTGRRPTVPAERAARVEAAVKAQWRADVRRAARRRWMWSGGALAAAATIAVGVGLNLVEPRAIAPAVDSPIAQVAIVSNGAWVQVPGAAATPLRPGDQLTARAEVATEDGGRVALLLTTGHSVRLDTGTRIRLLEERAIALDRGAVYVDSRGRPGHAAGALEVRTPLGTSRDVGTQFEVRWLTASLRVRVREGKVLFDATGTSVQVDAGRELELGPDGRMARREWPTAAAEFDWVSGVTPMLQIDGRSLQEFLEWMARERGLRLRFPSSRVAATAPGIRLNGSIQGMTLDQALDSVLSTCQMSHRIEGDELVVHAATSVRGTL
jgi:ferric-dicitrate binding protein FerR (iron transport regulator)